MIKNLLILFAFTVLIIENAYAQTTLSTGDAVFVGINSDGDDDFAFLLLTDITSGTVIYITDMGWNDGSGFYVSSGDDVLTWTANSSLSAGTVIYVKTTNGGIVEPGCLETNLGTISGSGSTITSLGDQVFLFQGTVGSPTLIAGIHYNVNGTTTSNWDGSATTNQTSALPDQLVNGETAIWVHDSGSENDDFYYSGGITSGDPATLRAAINNVSNWTINNSTAYTLNPFPATFSVASSCTEPDVPTVTASPNPVCSGSSTTLSISGSLNDATAWQIYTGSCGGSNLGSTATSSFSVSPSSTTSYYVRGEGGCVTPGSCGTVTITTAPVTAISAQPEVSTVVCENSSDITLSVTGTGTGTVTYQWYNGSGLIADEIASNLTIAANPANSGTYYCKVGSDCGSNVQSNNAVVFIKANSTGTDVQTACDSYTWIDGITYTESNSTATHTLTNASGCDSLVTLNLTINSSNTGDTVAVACDSFEWYGNTYTESGSPTHTLTNAAGCDSVVTLDLTINHSTVGTDTQIACNSYTWIDGITYTESNTTATYTLTNAMGCDSLVTLNLTINSSNTGDTVAVACDSFEWYGNTYTESGSPTHTLTNEAGCDSVVTLDLTINHSTVGTDTQVACNSYTWIDGITYTESNTTATYTLTNAMGCDSLVTLSLTVFPTYKVADEVTVSFGESYTFGTQTLSESGEYTESFSTIYGCDSTVALTFTVLAAGEKITNLTEANCGSFDFAGQTFTKSGKYYDTLQTITGADSIVVLNLTINPVYDETAELSINFGESYTFGTQTLTETGEYTEIFTSAEGCDSTVMLSLTVVEETVTITELLETACGSYVFAGETITESGTYRDTLQSQSGVDSILVLDLTVNPEYSVSDEVIVVFGESYTFGTQTLTESGEYSEVFTTKHGCDSTVMLTFVVLTQGETVTEFTEVACGSYVFSGEELIETGVYKDTLTSGVGADSIIILNLTVNPVYAESITETILDGEFFVFGSSTYTETGEYEESFSSVSGCDSIVTLNLIVDIAPKIIQIPSQILSGGSTSATIDLSDFISDETAFDELTWAVSSGTKIALEIIDGIATISVLDENWSGSETFTITATDGNGQSTSSNVTITYEAEVGISLFNAEASIHVYPNPTYREFNIETLSGSSFSVVVSTMTGAEVFKGAASGKMKVNLSNMPDGIYSVAVTNGGKTETVLLQIE